MGSREEHAAYDDLEYEEDEEYPPARTRPSRCEPSRSPEPMDAEASPAAAANPWAAPQPCDAALRVLFLLDITGSMEEEVEACKGAMQGLVSMCTASNVHAYADISFAVITFTESDYDGCFTSLFESTSPEAAQAYMDKIKPCCPPENPRVTNAGGDDGQENHKAALVRAPLLDPSVPTIAFLITDAQPHLGYPDSQTALHEYNYLRTNVPALSTSHDTDFFKIIHDTTLAHFGPNLVLNCVVFNSRGTRAEQPCPTQLFWGSVAQLTGGMLMQPETRDAHTLAAGLVSVLRSLTRHLMGGGRPQAQAPGEGHGDSEGLQGFKLIDLASVNPKRKKEADAAGSVMYAEDTEALFNIAMDRMVAVCGKKWTKRAIGMSAPATQLQFVWRAARYVSLCAKPTPSDSTEAAALAQAKADELSKLTRLRDQVLEVLPEDHRGHFSINEQAVLRMGEEAAAWAAAGGAEGAASAISLATVGEALEEDADWEDWLHSVMKLLLGVPVDVSLPLDTYGNPDFMDSWSAVLQRMGVDTISAAEFMQLIQDDSTAKGLTDKREYNAFLIMMPAQDDKLAELVLRIAGSTQALDYITSVLMGASKGFMPNLHTGLTAACLTRLLTQPTGLTDFQWAQIGQLAHTLCIRHTNAAKSVTTQLLEGQANPEDNISKFVLALLRLQADSKPAAAGSRAAWRAVGSDGSKRLKTSTEAATATGTAAAAVAAQAAAQQQRLCAALELVLQEWLASLMQRFYRKQSPETNALYYESVATYLPVGAVFDSSADAVSPLQRLHPLEVLHPDDLSTAAAMPAGVKPDWQAAVLQRLLGEVPGIPAHPMLVQFVLGAGRLLALLQLLPSAAAAQRAQKASIRTDRGSRAAPEQAAPISKQLPDALAALDSCWPKWRESALQTMLLRFRTARFTSKTPDPVSGDDKRDEAAAQRVGWEPAPVSSCLALAVGRLQDAHAAHLKDLKQARLQHAKQQLLQAAAALLLQHPTDAGAACKELMQLRLQIQAEGGEAPAAAGSSGPTASLLDVSYTLQRTDVPVLLEQLGASCGADPAGQPEQPCAGPVLAGGAQQSVTVSPGSVTPGLLRTLVLGSWCTQGAQVFKRNLLVRQLCKHFGAECDDVLAGVRALELCHRGKGHNRHGHAACMAFPGPDGWTPEYAAARLAAVAGKAGRDQIRVQAQLAAMHSFTDMAAWAKQAAAGDAEKSAAVAAELGAVQDARRHKQVLKVLQKILGQEMGGTDACECGCNGIPTRIRPRISDRYGGRPFRVGRRRY